jgi:chemotaxis protein methyltransferase CheR
MTNQKEFSIKDKYTQTTEQKFTSLIEKKSGIVFDHAKRRDLKQNILICMEEIGEQYFQNYYNRLISDPRGDKELKKLINFITINETYFFRVKEHFDILKTTVIPELIKKKKDQKISIWSAGASSGEEVYSIIISLLEIPELENKYQFEVWGTDINEEMLYVAKRGLYSGRTLNKVPKNLLEKYFEPLHKNRYKLKDTVTRHASFDYLNLAEPFGDRLSFKPDIIFFRNVLIYFNKETIKRIIDTFYNIQKDKGILFLGPSETLWDFPDRYKLMLFDKAYIYKKLDKPKPIKHQKPVSKPESLKPLPPLLKEELPVPKVSTQQDIYPTLKEKIKIKQEEAALMIELGDYKKAEKLLDEIQVIEKHSKPAGLLKMTIFANLGQKEKLQNFAQQITEKHPIFPELHYVMGRFFEAENKTMEAIKEYKKILFVDQEFLLARERLVKLYKKSGETTKGRREARNILDQLKTGNYKEFEHSVGENINKRRLKKFCEELLS